MGRRSTPTRRRCSLSRLSAVLFLSACLLAAFVLIGVVQAAYDSRDARGDDEDEDDVLRRKAAERSPRRKSP